MYAFYLIHFSLLVNRKDALKSPPPGEKMMWDPRIMDNLTEEEGDLICYISIIITCSTDPSATFKVRPHHKYFFISFVMILLSDTSAYQLY